MSFQPWHLKLRSHRGDDWVREYPEGSNFTVKNPIPNEEVNTSTERAGLEWFWVPTANTCF